MIIDQIDIHSRKFRIVLIIFFSIFSILFTQFYKRIFLNIDGVVRAKYTSDILLSSYTENLEFDDYKIFDKKLFISNNQTVTLGTVKEITVLHDNEEHELKTYAVDYLGLKEQVINELDLPVANNVSYNFFEKQSVLEADKLELSSIETKIETKIDEVGIETRRVANDQLTVGYEKVVEEGTPLAYLRTYEVAYENGKVVSQREVGSRIYGDGKPRVVEYGTLTIAEAIKGDTVWDKIAKCESGGRWNLNTGNGYYGGLQFHPGTWNKASKAVGVDAEYAHMATREEQIKAAEWLVQKAKSGFGQWPACSRKLGLIE